MKSVVWGNNSTNHKAHKRTGQPRDISLRPTSFLQSLPRKLAAIQQNARRHEMHLAERVSTQAIPSAIWTWKPFGEPQWHTSNSENTDLFDPILSISLLILMSCFETCWYFIILSLLLFTPPLLLRFFFSDLEEDFPPGTLTGEGGVNLS